MNVTSILQAFSAYCSCSIPREYMRRGGIPQYLDGIHVFAYKLEMGRRLRETS